MIGWVPITRYAGGVQCAVEVVADALVTAMFAAQIVVAPSLNVTVPVGLFGSGSWPAPTMPVTVAVYVTD